MDAKASVSALIGGAVLMTATLTMAQVPPSSGPPPAGRPPGVAAQPFGPRSALHIERDLEFARVGDRTLHLDLYLRDTPDKAPLPVVVWVHGEKSDKSPSPAARLVANGYAVASVDYRSVGEAAFPAQLYDVKAAVRWLRANAAKYNLDPAHIGAWGESGGGRIASLLGLTSDSKALEGDEGHLDQSSRVQAVADFFGPIDGSGASKAADPIRYVASGAPPFLIVHGTADTVVSPRQSERFEIALKHADVDTDLEYVPGAAHRMSQVQTPAIAEVVDTFFDKTLRGAKHQRDDVNMISEPSDSWIDPFPDDQPGTQYELYDTPSRGPQTQASYRIYLPPGYELPQNVRRRYPVIYFLHGFGDDSRSGVVAGYVQRADAAIRTGVMPPTIVVMVQALNGAGYVDNANGKAPVESVFIKDLIPHIDHTYRTIARREGRAIEGHSMGGSGAMQMAFKYPELFSSVTTFSAALVDNSGDAGITRDRFGGDTARLLAESPWALARKNADKIRGHMTIRMICGDKDSGGMARNQWMSTVLDGLHIDHAFLAPKGATHPVKEILARLDDNPFAYYATVFAADK